MLYSALSRPVFERFVQLHSLAHHFQSSCPLLIYHLPVMFCRRYLFYVSTADYFNECIRRNLSNDVCCLNLYWFFILYIWYLLVFYVVIIIIPGLLVCCLVFGSIILLVKSNAENVTTRHLNSLIKEKAPYEIVVLLASEDVFPNFKHGIECNEIE